MRQVLLLRKPRPQKIKEFAQSHQTTKWQLEFKCKQPGSGVCDCHLLSFSDGEDKCYPNNKLWDHQLEGVTLTGIKVPAGRVLLAEARWWVGAGVGKEVGEQAYPAKVQQMERPGRKKDHCPKNSPWIPLSQIPYSFTKKLFWLCLQSISSITPFPHSHSGAANSWEGKWAWSRGEGSTGKTFTPPERSGWDQILQDFASLSRSLEDTRLSEGGEGGWQGREGRNSVPGRRNRMSEDQTNRTSVWLQWPERWGEMQVEAGEAGRGQPLQSQVSSRGASPVSHGPWEPWIILSRKDRIGCALERPSGYIKRGQTGDRD